MWAPDSENKIAITVLSLIQRVKRRIVIMLNQNPMVFTPEKAQKIYIMDEQGEKRDKKLKQHRYSSAYKSCGQDKVFPGSICTPIRDTAAGVGADQKKPPYVKDKNPKTRMEQRKLDDKYKMEKLWASKAMHEMRQGRQAHSRDLSRLGLRL